MTQNSQITQEPATPTIKILHRWTGAVLHEVVAESVRAAVLVLVADKKDLAGANLADANLAGANLAGANLARAYLAGANLARAYLARAYLARAYLADADLAGALGVTTGEAPAVPPAPYVRDTSKNYQARAERYRRRHPEVPVIPDLDRKILAAIEAGGALEMGAWHTCDTTHCRAGWAVVLAGSAGKELEGKYGPHRAGQLIYGCGTGRVPHFFATNERAMEDIRKCAADADVAVSLAVQ